MTEVTVEHLLAARERQRFILGQASGKIADHARTSIARIDQELRHRGLYAAAKPKPSEGSN